MSQASIWPYFISACKGSFPWQAIFHAAHCLISHISRWPLPDLPYFTADSCQTIYFSRSRTSMSLWWGIGFRLVGWLMTICWCPSPCDECSSNAGSMLGQRRRRWPNIKSTLAEHPRYLGLEYILANTIRYLLVGQWLATVYDACPPFHRH